ncbi:MAG: NAD(P)-dependent alcohol dehydrogenase [Deltaproteobacteria bacterium]|nr:NAD(P)-dependent alcohol dehydrogenase [Deltaproteobacteria bacterium]
MRAWILDGGFGYEQLRMVERDEPPLSPDEVRIQVKACSLNYRDVLTVVGVYNPRLKLPLVPLSDGAGVVVEVGSAVQRFRVGDRVMGCFFLDWLTGEPPRDLDILKRTLGGPLDGMLAERVVLPERAVVATPAHLDDRQASTLPCAALTAWSALFREGHLSPGQVLVVQGTGGVSIAALQFGRLAGARVIVTSSSDAKLERARALGAHETINYRNTPEWSKEVRRLTGGVGADQVIEVGGAGTMPQSLRAVRPGGTISVIGVLAGAAGELALTPVLMQNLKLQGILVGPREHFEAMNRAITLHQVMPVVDRSYPFTEAPTALKALGDGHHFGKLVIDVSEA